jgi:hypothetical protein
VHVIFPNILSGDYPSSPQLPRRQATAAAGWRQPATSFITCVTSMVEAF